MTVPDATKSGLQAAPKAVEYAAQLKAIPQLAALGEPFKTSERAQLTEEETEYSVSVRLLMSISFNCLHHSRSVPAF